MLSTPPPGDAGGVTAGEGGQASGRGREREREQKEEKKDSEERREKKEREREIPTIRKTNGLRSSFMRNVQERKERTMHRFAVVSKHVCLCV